MFCLNGYIFTYVCWLSGHWNLDLVDDAWNVLLQTKYREWCNGQLSWTNDVFPPISIKDTRILKLLTIGSSGSRPPPPPTHTHTHTSKDWECNSSVPHCSKKGLTSMEVSKTERGVSSRYWERDWMGECSHDSLGESSSNWKVAKIQDCHCKV